MEVIKTPVPSLAADFLGGAVNLIPKSSFERSKPQLTVRGTFQFTSDDYQWNKTPGPGTPQTRKLRPGFEASLVYPVTKNFGFTISSLISDQFGRLLSPVATWQFAAAQGGSETAPYRQTVKMPPSQSGNDGPIDVHLVTSTDGEAWQRTWPRMPVIPRGAPGTFDGGTILGVTSTCVHAGDESWLLYTAINTGHGGPIPPKRITVGRATWRLHGFASLDASPAGGRIETRPLILPGGALLINANASRGRLRAALREADGAPMAGCTVDDFVPLQADATRSVARWRGGQVPSDRPVRVVIEMTSTRLYSLAAR